MNNISREEFSRKVCDLVKKVLRVEGDVTENTHFANDLGADSLDVVELVMALEETFDVRVNDDDVTGIRTVGDVVNALQAL